MARPSRTTLRHDARRRPRRLGTHDRTACIGQRRLSMILGERVRQVRQMHRFTQEDLADRTEILTQSQISRLEKGRLQPSASVAERIAAETGTTVALLQRPIGINLSRPVHYRARAATSQRDRAESIA